MKDYFARLTADNWGVLDVMLTASSPIDLPRLAIRDQEDAERFLRSYGYDLHQPKQAAQLDSLRREALDCLERLFLNPTDSIPELVRESGPLELLLLASCPPDLSSQQWACALLRVMHTLSHVSTELSLHYFPAIREQILTPYQALIHQHDGQFWIGLQDFNLPLVDFQIKAGKERDSALIKLLHKRDNVAADLFDRIGIRFVTHDRLDALLLLHFLREKHLVAFPNIKPRRLNNLIDIAGLRELINTLKQRYEQLEISLEDVERLLRQGASLEHLALQSNQTHNPHSSAEYQAIQFTVRQLVRLPAQPGQPASDLSFYFPYEIQIVDQMTHVENMQGQASHAVYKQRQRESARKRVLGPLYQPLSLPETSV